MFKCRVQLFKTVGTAQINVGVNASKKTLVKRCKQMTAVTRQQTDVQTASFIPQAPSSNKQPAHGLV